MDGDELCAECVLDGLDIIEGSDEQRGEVQ